MERSQVQRSDQRLAWLASVAPSRRAVGCGDSWLTYDQWNRRSREVADWLREHGLTGHAVGLKFKPTEALDFVAAYVGVHAAGCTAIPLNTRLTDRDHRDQLTEAGAACLLTAAGAELLARPDSPNAGLIDITGGQLADIVFTSGTTSAAKGTLISHASLWGSAVSTAEYVYGGLPQAGQLVDGTLLTTFPVYSSMSTESVINVGLYAGVAQYFLADVDASTFTDRLEELDARIVLVPPAVLALWRNTTPCAPARPTHYVTAGAPVPTDLAAWLLDLVKPAATLVNFWGMTEGGIMIAVDEEISQHAGAIGRPLGDCKIQILAEDGTSADRGELWVSDPDVDPRQGYLNRPEASAHTFHPGWIRTGDIVHIEDGVVCLEGRVQEWINRGGYKFLPVEVEDVVSSVDGVLDSAALAIDHDVLGEDVTLCVLVAADASRDVVEARIRSVLEDNLADFKRPRTMHFFSSFPRNANGKTDRRALHEQLIETG